MVEKKFTCPVCGLCENTYKVSDIYLQSLERLKNGDKAEAPVIDKLQEMIPEDRRGKLKGSRYYRALMESFAPPQGDTQITRPVNPDWIVVATGVFSIFFLFQIFTTQYAVFWIMLIFTLVAFASYVIFRNKIILKYEVAKGEHSGSVAVVEKAIGEWMKLYYCSTDNIVFSAKKGEQIPLEHMKQYLLETSQKE